MCHVGHSWACPRVLVSRAGGVTHTGAWTSGNVGMWSSWRTPLCEGVEAEKV